MSPQIHPHNPDDEDTVILHRLTTMEKMVAEIHAAVMGATGVVVECRLRRMELDNVKKDLQDAQAELADLKLEVRDLKDARTKIIASASTVSLIIVILWTVLTTFVPFFHK